MSSAIKNGKVPMSRKQDMTPISYEDIFDNPLGIDKSLTDVLTKQGYSYRFINAKRFAEMGGQHQGRWRPVSLKQLKEWGYDTMSVIDFKDGSDPDGYVRRAELVLAIRPIELNENHKRYLAQQAERAQVKNLTKTHASEARQRFGQRGSGIQVHTGYQHDYMDEQDDQE